VHAKSPSASYRGVQWFAFSSTDRKCMSTIDTKILAFSLICLTSSSDHKQPPGIYSLVSMHSTVIIL
jgi:hypothetical protein